MTSESSVEAYDVGCEKCGLVFEFPIEGGQPAHGEFGGVPLCPDCYFVETSEGEDDADDS